MPTKSSRTRKVKKSSSTTPWMPQPLCRKLPSEPPALVQRGAGEVDDQPFDRQRGLALAVDRCGYRDFDLRHADCARCITAEVEFSDRLGRACGIDGPVERQQVHVPTQFRPLAPQEREPDVTAVGIPHLDCLVVSPTHRVVGAERRAVRRHVLRE